MPKIGDKNTLKITGFSDVYLGKRIYELTLDPTPYITATGAAVAQLLNIPLPHRLIRVEVKHTDGSDVDSVTAFTWFFQREIARGLFEKLIDYSSSTKTDFNWVFGEGYEHPAMNYRISQNTTDTHRVYLKITIQLLE